MILPSRVTLMAWQHTYTVEGIRLFVLWQVTCSLRWNKRTKLQRMNDSDVISPYPGPRIGRRLQLISQLISQKSQRRTSYFPPEQVENCSWARGKPSVAVATQEKSPCTMLTKCAWKFEDWLTSRNMLYLTVNPRRVIVLERDEVNLRYGGNQFHLCLKEVSMLRKMKWKPSVRKGPSLPVSLREVSVSERCLLEGDDVRTESATGTNSILLSLRGVWLREMSVLEEDEVKVWSARGTQSTCLS